jgi:hypothetical protein
LKAFSASIEMTKWCAILKIFVCWTIPVSKDEANRSFWYVVGFGLPLHYCGFLHQCSLGRLAYSSPFWMCSTPPALKLYIILLIYLGILSRDFLHLFIKSYGIFGW